VCSCEHSNEPLGSIKGWGVWLVAWLLASQEGLCSMQLVSYTDTRETADNWFSVCTIPSLNEWLPGMPQTLTTV
jgi:hypothetical protein